MTLAGSKAYKIDFTQSLKRILSLLILRTGMYAFIETLCHAYHEHKKNPKTSFIQFYFDKLIKY